MAMNYGQAQDDTIEILDVIAQKIVVGWTGQSNCDECDSLKLESALNILTAIRDAGFIIMRENKPAEDKNV